MNIKAKDEANEFDPNGAWDNMFSLKALAIAMENLVDSGIPESEQEDFLYGASRIIARAAEDFDALLNKHHSVEP